MRRRRFHRPKGIPIVPAITLASTVVTPCPSGRTILGDLQAGNFEDMIYDLREKFACIDNTGKFQTSWAINTYTPIIASVLVSRLLGRYVNPTLKRVPMIGRYLRL